MGESACCVLREGGGVTHSTGGATAPARSAGQTAEVEGKH